MGHGSRSLRKYRPLPAIGERRAVILGGTGTCRPPIPRPARRCALLTGYAITNGRLERVADPQAAPESVAWFDVESPTREEEAFLEQFLGVELPNREDMEEIEFSSRMYVEDTGTFLTVLVVTDGDRDDTTLAPVSLVLAQRHLVTIHYGEPRSIGLFVGRATKGHVAAPHADAILVGLLETVVDRLADILERAGREVDGLSRLVFRGGDETRSSVPRVSADFREVLELVGRKGTLASNVRDSLLTLQRSGAFLTQTIARRKGEGATKARVKTLARDVQSLLDHVGFLTQKVQFLLDATLGLIGIEQNAIIKIFSVAATVFLPPTLIASIYGMNFEHMPELGWPVGYPAALVLMVVSAVLPYWFFKRKGWL